MNNKLLLALPFVALSSVALAEDKTEKKSPITASAELGFLYKTGNTKSGDIKTGFNVKYEKAQWLSLLDFDLLVKKTEVEENGKDVFETSDQKWSITSQTNYTLSAEGKNYMYANASYEDNRFSSFDNQSSISTGWGRHWYKTEKASLFADVGPGYKRDVISATDSEPTRTEGSFIVQAQALYLHQLNEHVEFKQLLVAKYAVKSGENSKYKAESSITTKLIETLQLKFTFTIDHNTEVEEGRENTDTQTAMTLVYSF